MRRGTPELLVSALITLLLASYVWYTRSVVVTLRAGAKRSSEMYARVYHAFGDNTPGAQDQALLNPSQSIREQGVPLIWTDLKGVPHGHANLPFDRRSTLPD